MSTPDYANYGGKRPEIPEGWVEVGYRVPRENEPFINSCTGGITIRTRDNRSLDDADFARVILHRKPNLDPAMVAPKGYQFRLDEYGRPVCRAPKAGEWFLVWSDRFRTCQAGADWEWADCHYILDPIPEPPKMTIVEAAKAAIGTGRGMRRRAWPNSECSIRDRRAVNINPIDALADDWEVMP